MTTQPMLKDSKITGVQSRYIGQFVVLWIVGVLTYMGMGFVSPLFSTRIIEQGFSLSDFGIAQGLATLLSISSQVYIGKLSDRIGKRKPMVVSAIFLMLPVVILFPHARSLSFFIVLLGLNQMATSLFSATTANWVTRFGVHEHLGRLHGFFRISFSVGWVLATMFMGTLLDNLGFHGTFYFATLFLAVSLILTIIGAKENTTEPILKQKTLPATASFGIFKWPSELKLILVALGIFICAQTMGINLNYIFFRDEMGVTNQQFGWLTSVQSWPEIPLMLFLGIMSDKISSTVLLASGMVVAGMRWLLMSLVKDVSLLFFIQPLHAVGMTVTEVLIVAVIARLTPSEHLGVVMGWQITVVNTARFLAPLLAGVIGEHLGIRTVFLMSSFVAMLAGLVISKTARMKRKESMHDRKI